MKLLNQLLNICNNKNMCDYMEKLGGLIANILSNNATQLIQDWDTKRAAYSLWHHGAIDNQFLRTVNEFVANWLLKSQNEGLPSQIDLILESPGGEIEPAFQAISLIDRSFPSIPINFIVPGSAKSAATLIACGANKILFSQIGELGPLDVQIKRNNSSQRVSGITIKRLVDEELKGKNSNKNMVEWIQKTLTPEEVLEMKRFNDVVVKYLKIILPKRMFPGRGQGMKINKVINNLCENYPNHSFAINHDICKNDLSLNVDYVDAPEGLLLQNMLAIWEYQVRLSNAINLNTENTILKNMLRGRL
jgi:hypothetical protein